ATRAAARDGTRGAQGAVGAEDALSGAPADAAAAAVEAFDLGPRQLHVPILRGEEQGSYDRSRGSEVGGWPAHVGQPCRVLPPLQPQEGRQDAGSGADEARAQAQAPALHPLPLAASLS